MATPVNGNHATKKREYYLDNLKSSLTGLVVFHHTALCYGGIGRTVYQDPLHPQLSSPVLSVFNAANQTFFMGSFFYMSGYYSAKTARRKTSGQFAKDKIYRLGLPTVAYTLLAPPLCKAILTWHKGGAVGTRILVDHVKSLRGVRGPVWFTALLLVFDLAYIALKQPAPSSSGEAATQPSSSDGLVHVDDKPPTSASSPPPTAAHPSTLTTLFALGLTSGSSFLLQACQSSLPAPLSSLVQFLSLVPGYLPGYILSYTVGTRSSAPLSVVPSSTTTAILVPIATAAAATASSLLLSQKYTPADAFQGLNVLSACYAVGNEVAGYLLGSGALVVFEKYANERWLGGWVGRYAFSAFLVHIPVLVGLGAAAESWVASPGVKFAVVGTGTVVASWVVGAIGSEIWGHLEGWLGRLVGKTGLLSRTKSN